MDGTYYDGEWQYGKRHGEGEEKQRDGAVYKGSFFNDVKHGRGRLYLPDGSYYEVNYENGLMNGPGTHTDMMGKVTETRFYYGLEMKVAEQNPDCYNNMLLNLFLVIGFAICL